MLFLLTSKGFAVPTLFGKTLAPHRPSLLALQRSKQPQHPPRGRQMGAAFSASAQPELVTMIKEKNAANPVMIYSNSVKDLFRKLNVPVKVVELDELADGADVQEALKQVTGRSTVPQVFVGSQHVGGCDDTLAANSSGKLKELLQAAGLAV